LREALLGFKRELKHLDGRNVEIDREGQMTKPGFMQTIKEEGMPKTGDNSERGDLHVDFVVEFP
jgi:DnaJ-related protein SCJ1